MAAGLLAATQDLGRSLADLAESWASLDGVLSGQIASESAELAGRAWRAARSAPPEDRALLLALHDEALAQRLGLDELEAWEGVL